MRRFLILFATLSTGLGAQARQPDPADYLYPVRHVKRLYSANFGEIRPGHFHSGVDIKTEGVEGKPVVATADGYVSRAVLRGGGYGRALYLVLGNGTTAVYGHLQRFCGDIEEYVQRERCRRRSNDVDLWFGPAAWPVKQGEVIAFSGDSGASGGPHLHFEVRDTETQRLRNIVREGIIRPKDDLPPRIVRLHYFEVDTVAGVPVHSAPESYPAVRVGEGRYRLTHDGPVGVGRRGYFAAEVTDRRNGVQNTFGVWRVTAFTDSIPCFEYRMDGFTFDLSRCSDAVSCHALQVGSRNEVIRLAQLAAAPDCFYPVMKERGLLRTAEGQQRRIRIEAEDDCGNRSSLEFTVRGRPGAFRAEADTAATALRTDQAATLRIGGEAEARVPQGALYEPIFVHPARREAPAADTGVVVLSPAYRFFSPATPLRKAVQVSIRTRAPRPLLLRAALAARSRTGKLVYIGDSQADGTVTARTRTTGDIVAVADTLPPAIRPLFAEGADLGDAESLRFHAADNFSGIASWQLEIDGEWVPCDRFPRKGTLVHRFDTPRRHRSHTATLRVRDGCGNTSQYEGTFYR